MFFDSLPEEIIIAIIIKLDYKQIIYLSLDNKFLSITKNNYLWRQKLMQDFPTAPTIKLCNNQLYYCWYARFELNLTMFNQILSKYSDEVDNKFLDSINSTIRPFGPLVYTHTPLILCQLTKDEFPYQIDDSSWNSIENAIFNCFDPMKGPQKTKKLEEKYDKKLKLEKELESIESKLDDYQEELDRLLGKIEDAKKSRYLIESEIKNYGHYKRN